MHIQEPATGAQDTFQSKVLESNHKAMEALTISKNFMQALIIAWSATGSTYQSNAVLKPPHEQLIIQQVQKTTSSTPWDEPVQPLWPTYTVKQVEQKEFSIQEPQTTKQSNNLTPLTAVPALPNVYNIASTNHDKPTIPSSLRAIAISPITVSCAHDTTTTLMVSLSMEKQKASNVTPVSADCATWTLRIPSFTNLISTDKDSTHTQLAGKLNNQSLAKEDCKKQQQSPLGTAKPPDTNNAGHKRLKGCMLTLELQQPKAEQTSAWQFPKACWQANALQDSLKVASELMHPVPQPTIWPSAPQDTAKFPDWDNRTTIWFPQVPEPTTWTAVLLHMKSTASKSHPKLVSANASRPLQALVCLQKPAQFLVTPELPPATVMLDISDAKLASSNCNNQTMARIQPWCFFWQHH